MLFREILDKKHNEYKMHSVVMERHRMKLTNDILRLRLVLESRTPFSRFISKFTKPNYKLLTKSIKDEYS